jgi:nicotinamide mononucleotide transporter
MIHWLNSAAFHFAGADTTWAELFGFVTGLWCVFLVARNNILTFPVGIANAIFFFILFLDAKLYADMALQVFFIVIQVVGWWAWLRAGPRHTELVVAYAKTKLLVLVAVLGVALAIILVPVLREAHGSYPKLDATTTSLSICAQCLMSFRLVQNWYLWIAADLIYIPLYAVKGLYFTSILYVLFLTLCFLGLLTWRKLARKPERAEVHIPLAKRLA